MRDRQPRPLVASDSLLRALDRCARTSVKGLGGSRAKKPRLSLDALGRLEADLGIQLHDDILVVLAVGDPVMRLFTGLGDLHEVPEADARPAPEGWVTIASVYGDPVGELLADDHGGAYVDLAVPVAPALDEARVLVGGDGFRGWGAMDETEGQTLDAFLAEIIHTSSSGEQGDHVRTSEPRPEPLSPAPTLVAGRKPTKRPGQGGRVAHPKFGEGEVLERLGEGDEAKVIVRFEDKQRTMLAKFLSPVG